MGKGIIWKGLSTESYKKVSDIIEKYVAGIDPYNEKDSPSKSIITSKFRRCGDIKKTMIMLEEAKQYYNDEWNQGDIRE